MPVGEYTVKEIASKFTVGYVLSDEENAIVAADEIIEMTINNKLIRGDIRIIKTDADTGKPLAGAVFGLFQNEMLIVEATSDEGGIAEFLDVPYGKYTIKEISAPEGYKKNDKAFKVKIKENGETIELEIKNVKIPQKPFLPSIPNTGDNSNIFLWLVIMGASVASLVGLTVMGNRRKKNEKEA